MNSDSTPTTVWLEVADGGRYPIHGNCSLGRSSKNSFIVRAVNAGRRHAIIHAQNGSDYLLVDLGSVNGTTLNGHSVIIPQLLRDGDRIGIAGITLTFRQSTPEAAPGDTGRTALNPTVVDVRNEPGWLLIADIVGFTRLNHKLDAKTLAMTVGRWMLEGTQIVERHQGTVRKYLGDGYLALWECDTPVERVISALNTVRLLRTRSNPEFRVVLHQGLVVMGGSEAPGEESLIGPDVIFAFRMEKIASALCEPFLFSEAAQCSLGALLPLELVPGEHEVKGSVGKHRFFRLPST